jgi:hypothetical protein
MLSSFVVDLAAGLLPAKPVCFPSDAFPLLAGVRALSGSVFATANV